MKSRPRSYLVLVLLAALVAATAPLLAGPLAEGSAPPQAKAIRVTPPAPVIDDQARVAELAARRAKVAEKIGPKGILVLFSADQRFYTNDVFYEYRQENNLYYLTNLKQKGATLVMIPGNSQTREVLFLPRRVPALETWNGRMYSPEDARRRSGITEIWEAKEFEPFINALRRRQPYHPKPENVLMSATAKDAAAASPAGAAADLYASSVAKPVLDAAMKNEAELYLLIPRADDDPEYRKEQRMASEWAKTANGFTLRNAWPIFTELRLRKSPMELQLLQHAIDITTEALGRAMAAAGSLQWEYEVEAEVEYVFKRRNADYWGYPSIVGCGPNATTLHYEESQGRINQGDLLLMDVGAEYDHYTADVTRTFPVSGKFTPAQADIYNVVLAAQEAGMKASRPGGRKSDVHRAATEVIKDGLLRLGLITDRNSPTQYRLWFMHGTSHWLGMNVHDVGADEPLEPGMVYTNEPGIYVRPDALDYLEKTPANEKFIAAIRPAFEKYKNIGVRIEDDVLITADGYRNMTAALPRTIPEIENFIAQAAREFRLTSARTSARGRDGLLPVAVVFDALSGQQLVWSPDEALNWRAIAEAGRPRTLRRGFVFAGSIGRYAPYDHRHGER
jgi:Xaa-Pro aminopeptidase